MVWLNNNNKDKIMSEESTENTSTDSNETVNSQESTETNAQQEETQQTSTESTADTSTDESKENVGELGIEKKEDTDNVKSGESDISALDSLVQSALEGTLTDEQKQMIEEAGIGKHFDMILAGHKAQIEANDKAIIGVVGNKEQYNKMQEWASANLSEQEIAAFNNAVLHSGDVELAKLAVQGLHAKFISANGQAPNTTVESGNVNTSEVKAFTSADEYIKEALSFKYKSDPEYAAMVEARRNKSGF